MNVTAGNLLKDLKNRLRMIEQGQIEPSEEIVRYTKDTIHILESMGNHPIFSIKRK